MENTNQDIFESYLSIIQTELSEHGILNEFIHVKNNKLEIEDHFVDMARFLSKHPWSRSDMKIRAYTTDDGRFIFMPDQAKYAEYRENDALWDELSSYYKIVQVQINEINSHLYETLREQNDQKSLAQRIPSYVSQNLENATDSLGDIESWKVRIILGNSVRRGDPGVGELDNVGYTHFGLNTGTIVPVARGDEHNRGYDLIHFLMEKDLIPQDSYSPIFFHGDYVNGYDAEFLQALKTWRKMGGKNIIIKNSMDSRNDTPFQLTIDDYIKLDGKIEIRQGELFPIGEAFINHLSKLSELCTSYRNTQRGEKQVYAQSLRLMNFYKQNILQHTTKYFEEMFSKALEAEKIGGMEGLQKLEEVIFGFEGLKNSLHQDIRNGLKPEATKWDKRDVEAIFGDLELANHKMGSI